MSAAKTGTRKASVGDGRVVVDLNDLTVGEIEYFEDQMGQPILAYTDAGALQGRALRVLGFLMKRRENEEFTYEESANLRVGIKFGEAVPPTAESD